ncbi:kinesin-like protein, putative, partial [Bodo saltans]
MIEGLDEGSNRKDVSVVVRVRAGAENAIVRCSRPLPQSQTVFHEVSVGDGDKNRFTFDAVFGPHCSQADLYAAIGADVVKHSLEGYNACVMTYGQTSSGKTFSMLGPDGGSDRLFGDRTVDVRASEELGLVPRVLDTLFRRRNDKSSGEVSTNIEISCVELYNEVFFDLLSGDAEKSQNLRIREDANRGIFIEGAASLPVDNTPQLFDLLAKISSSKHTSFTAMNATSSRSHTIITVSVDQVDHVRHDSTTNSRIFLVDLAGSERIEKTGAMGDRLKEAQNINLSLTLLGNVIKKLTDGKSMHIPYRDSKLTRLLQNSLGGN